MIEQNEIIMLFLGIGCMIFILVNKQKVKRIPAAKILIAGFYVLLAGYILTSARPEIGEIENSGHLKIKPVVSSTQQ